VLNDVICAYATTSTRQVHIALDRLEAAGWIARVAAPGARCRRKIVLLWKLPDDLAGLVPEPSDRDDRALERSCLPLFAGQGGAP
jgi:hypothetical protein